MSINKSEKLRVGRVGKSAVIKGTRRSEKTTTVTTRDQQSHRQTKGNHRETKETNKSDESESEEEEGEGEGEESRPQTHEPQAEGNTAGPYGAVAGSPVTTWVWLLLPPLGAGERERERNE